MAAIDDEETPLLIPPDSDSAVYSIELVQVEADLVFESLIRDAVTAAVDPKPNYTSCPWISPDRARKGKDFFSRNYFVCVWSIFVSQLAQGPILQIDNPNYGRFNLTKQILKWFKQDILRKKSKISLDLHHFRRARDSVRQDQAEIPGAFCRALEHVNVLDFVHSIVARSSSTELSQIDLVFILGCCHFLSDVAPHRVGLHRGDTGYEHYIHHLAVIGRRLGLQDRFNLALISNPDIRKQVSLRIWNEIVAPSFKMVAIDDSDHNLVTRGANPSLATLHARIVFTEALGEAADTHAQLAQQHVNLIHRFLYVLLRFAIWGVRHRPIAWLINCLIEIVIWFMFLTEPEDGRSRNNVARVRAAPTPVASKGSTFIKNQPPCLFV